MSHNSKTNLTKSNAFPIACVGASAGGLEALISLFNALPKNIRMAFVLIQHLEPQHKSALPEILSRETPLTICEAKNNTKIEPSNVYVIPPNARIAISRRRLKVTTRIKRPDGRYLPIDFFMVSLAHEERKKAVGIILSGTGSDGTQGAKAIKAMGGSIFAQDENTARYFGMPGSVVASGAADFVLPPKEIARKLVYLGSHGQTKVLKPAGHYPAAKNGFAAILVLLRDLVGVDFMHYKQATVRRRIDLRMSFHSIKSHDEYYRYLKKYPEEASLLLKNLLISVTSFFRDPAVFAALSKKVFASVSHNRPAKDPIRVWVPACSSGEEVYSIAIALYEFLEGKKLKHPLQIFGTDLSQALIDKARSGSYAEDILSHVSVERLRRFFTRTDAGYKIAKHIRDLCIFAKHDITVDPPLSNMDIESCRNLLIYLDAFLQNKALSMLHYALKPKGFLVLGTSESVNAVPALFTAVDIKNKIYAKNSTARRLIPFSVRTKVVSKAAFPKAPRAAKKAAEVSRAKIKKRLHPGAAALDKITAENMPKDTVVLRKKFLLTVERLNAMNEEKDTFNEELKAANEEIQSSNEELQSMNEELETSKEELQSTNEELVTLNEELQNKNAELTHLNSDLSNVFSSTNIPVIIVNNGLRIKRFTPTARKVMNLIPTDIDRPIGDIKLNLDIVNLETMIQDVIEDMVSKELEVKDQEGRWYSMRIRPYRTVDNKIDGAIISLIDIDAIRRSREEMESILNYNQAIIETMREPLVVLDKNLRVLSANKSFYNTFKVGGPEVKDKLLYELGGHQWDNPKLRKLLGEILSRKNHFNDFEVSFDFPGIGEKTMVLNGRQIKLHGKDSPLILLVIEDITKRKVAEDILKRDNKALDKMVAKRSEELLRLQVKLVRSRHLSAIGTMAATVAHELRNPLADIALLTHRVKKNVTDPLMRKMLADISARVVESDQIISNILMYSKSAILHYEPVKINEILRAALDDEAQGFSMGKIAINERIGRTKDLTIEADPVRIKEVFRNIVHNALEAVRTDTGIIEVESEVKKFMVSIVIKDNGKGIDKKDLKNVASPFFTTKAKGTGLGLALCKQVVMLHSGSMAIHSDEGKGAMVTVTLPILKQKNE